jgi:1-acyl-sn-glycerol-3-phosphate acyltransferase
MAYNVLQRILFPPILRRVRIIGEENIPTHGPFLAASNHVSYVEPILLALIVIRRTNQRVYSLTKHSVWRFFHAIGLAEWLGMVRVPVDHRERTIEWAAEKLRAGYPVLLFPEGTRSFDGVMKPAKTGVVRLASSMHIPVIPIGYRGRAARSTLNAFRSFFRFGNEITITIGEPMHFSSPDHTHEELAQMARDVMRRIASLAGTTYPY